MSYVHKELPDEAENVNVSKTHPLNDFFILMGGMLGLLMLIWSLLGLAVDWLVPHIDTRMEGQLAGLYSSLLEKTDSGPVTQTLQSQLDQLVALQYPDLHNRPNYYVHHQADSDSNAFALPGGHILVLSGLLKQAKSQNEVDFILGHELGHLAHRDHLRSLGRGLVLLTMTNTLFGNNNILSDSVAHSLGNLQLRFSRNQEKAADELGLELLVKHYGHAGGATDFFKRLSKEEKSPRFLSYLSTHPHPQERVENLQALIQSKGYKTNTTEPVLKVLKDAKSDVN